MDRWTSDETACGAESPDAFAAAARACRLCADLFAATPTAHAPAPVMQISATARLCIAGQAPGWRVHNSGRPFTDPSGVRLRTWLGVDEAQFYDASRVAILPMAFCFPGHDAKGGDLPPPKRCAETWRARAFAAHPAFSLTLLVGAHAQAWHLGRRGGASLTETVRAGPRDGPDGRRYWPLPHPSWRNNAWLKSNVWFEDETLPALRDEIASLFAG